MKKWEYELCYEYNDDALDSFLEQLNKMGEEGWKAQWQTYEYNETDNSYFVFMEREKLANVDS